MTDSQTGAVSAHNAKVMNRFELTKRVVGKLKRDEAVIGGIGNANFDLWACGQRPQNFYMLGSMGLAIPIAPRGAKGGRPGPDRRPQRRQAGGRHHRPRSGTDPRALHARARSETLISA